MCSVQFVNNNGKVWRERCGRTSIYILNVVNFSLKTKDQTWTSPGKKISFLVASAVWWQKVWYIYMYLVMFCTLSMHQSMCGIGRTAFHVISLSRFPYSLLSIFLSSSPSLSLSFSLPNSPSLYFSPPLSLCPSFLWPLLPPPHVYFCK